MKRILILVNDEVVIYNFRKELVEKLLNEKYEVFISSPSGDKINELVAMGCHHVDLRIDRHGTNPINDIKLLNYYFKIMKQIKPDIVLTYTIKPNIYGSLAAKRFHIPAIVNITGLGSALGRKGILQKITVVLYKLALRSSLRVYFQNVHDQKFFLKHRLVHNNYALLPGSGVNLAHFKLLPYPGKTSPVAFVFISRIMKQKGIDQYLEVAQYIKNKYPGIEFHVCGSLEDDYKEILTDYQNRGIIEYHGMVQDIRQVLAQVSCTIHPTYYPEGLSNAVLESAASGRPVITTNRPGTAEAVVDQRTGYLFEALNSNDLIKKIEEFLSLNYAERKEMGIRGRAFMEQKFNRKIVVNSYMKLLREI
ncbi:glycosyltransferase family 1 protein [Loigolactobacillus backii]|uniref:glycosyltransferase family 4 protein n=1 Tax=Loigolactobacillus backii TaxID=375175 RepID=UPI000C1CA61A|nr:glycosyltransferase family 4 protein [Loigolactobacillus backii]PIO82992.1 glycosyltransferase family 1 protein [Loigolactobacillus backii]